MGAQSWLAQGMGGVWGIIMPEEKENFQIQMYFVENTYGKDELTN